MVLSTGNTRTLRLFSSDKHFSRVKSGQSTKSKYNPIEGNFNFAVPDERTLIRSQSGIPQFVPSGIIYESFNILDTDKEYFICMDGKQIGRGLKDMMQGDVDLWGFEGPPSLKDTIDRIENKISFVESVYLEVIDKKIDIFSAYTKLKKVLRICSL